MPKKVIIAADSTCDLSPELVKRYDIRILPLYVNLGDKVCRDGVNVTPNEIYDFVSRTGVLPTTAAANPVEYRSYFQDLQADSDCDVIFINIGGYMSSCHQNARLAAEDLPGVYVVDSMNLSTGSGHLVIEAAEMAEAGMPAADIVKELEDLRAKVDASFVIDTLEYLHKGGRCSSVAALGANLLKLKPCIEVVDGRMRVGKKYRGSLAAVLPVYASDRLAGKSVRRKRVFITHSGCDAETVSLVRDKVESLGMFDEIIETRAGCTITCHCGPGTLGVLFIRN